MATGGGSRRRQPDGAALAGAVAGGAAFDARGRLVASAPSTVARDVEAVRDDWRRLVEEAEYVRAAARGHAIGLAVGTHDEFRALVKTFAKAGWRVPEDPVTFAAQLGAAADVGGFHYVTARARPPAEWLWPLDLALLDDTNSRALEQRLGELRYLRFVTPMRATGATRPIELLVWPGGLADAGDALARCGRMPRVQLLLVLGGTGGSEDPIGDAEGLRQLARADAVCVTDVDEPQWTELLDELLEELSHDLDADVAFSLACGSLGVPPPFMVACAGGFARAHLGRWGKNLVQRLDRMPDTMVAANGGPARPARDVGDELAGTIDDFKFEHESAEATDISELGRRVRAKPPDPGARDRRVQAELKDRAGHRVEKSPLLVGRYRLEVWIGEATAGAIVAAVRFPEEDLPESATGHRLTIALSAPGVLETPVVKPLDLPAHGSSKRVSFTLELPAALARLEARVTVLHENRIVQTLLLRADVGSGDSSPLELLPESVLRRDLDGLAGRRPFDVALLFNRLGGASTMTAFQDDKASMVDLAGVNAFVDEIERILKDATDRPTRHGKPDTPETSALLADLARQGALLHEELFYMPGVREELKGAKRIQIVSAKAGAILPLEVCYDERSPSAAAKMCKHWAAALEDGECTSDCPADKHDTVCPVGFWGMKKVIERHAFDHDMKLGGADFAVTSEPSNTHARLPVLDGALCAAAKQARNHEPAAVDKAFAAIRDWTRSSKEVTDWKAWKAEVEGGSPQMLVLLPHTDLLRKMRTLVIGTDSALFGDVERDYLAGANSDGVSLVLLLGCSTAGEEIPLQNFSLRFHRKGARIVVATLCKILGRHAAPVAEALVRGIAEASKAARPSSLGDVMVRIRRDLVTDGLPIILALTVFGDADWQI